MDAKTTAGAKMMIGFEGTELSASLKHYISEYRLGGVILFKRNVEDPKQLAALCAGMQDYAAQCGLAPLFIAIDQEGGTVSRLGAPFSQFPKGAPGLKTVAGVQNFAEITSLELKTCNINMNMAPVLDIAPKGFGSFIEKRALGDNPATVSKLGLAMVQGFQNAGVIPVGKHFPGIGRTVLDSHIDLPVFEDTLESLQEFDLIPFKDAINNGLEAVMLSHILYNKLDNAYPASVSRKIAHGLLRNEMGFNGVVMTDDMDMGALINNYGFEDCVDKAAAAGVDMLLVCRESDRIDRCFARLLDFAQQNANAARESFDRIMALKYKYLLQPPASDVEACLAQV